MADDQVGRVKQATDIVEVIGQRVQLKKAGRNFKGLCPFHGEKTPSFFVSGEMQMYKCFGCGVNGDVFTFVQEYEGLTFPEALEQLAERAGIKLEKRVVSGKDMEKEDLLKVLHLAQEYYHFLLTEHAVGEEARAYLKKRGIHKQQWKDFGLGYAAANWRGLQTFLGKKKGFDNRLLEKSGMVLRSEKGRYYDRFRGRVMFPLRDFSGKVVGFSGRLLDDNEKEAKYINTPETTLYHKSEMLYGMYENKRVVREKDRVIVVEGEMDVISSVQAKLGEVVAVKGSALTEQQVMMVRRLTRNIVLALDADAAGQEAISRAIDVAEAKGMNLRVLPMAGGKDPDEIARDDPKAWREMTKKTVSIYQFYIDLAFEKYDGETGEGQKQISGFLAPILSKIENAVEREFYVKKLADRLGVGKRVVEEELAKAAVKVIRPEPVVEEKKKLGRQERLERYVVGLGMHLGAKWSEDWVKLESDWFEEAYLQRLVEEVAKVIGQMKRPSLNQVQDKVGAEVRPLMMELYGEDKEWLLLTQEELRRVHQRAVEDLRAMAGRKRLRKLTQEMAALDAGDERLVQLREEYDLLKRST